MRTDGALCSSDGLAIMLLVDPLQPKARIGQLELVTSYRRLHAQYPPRHCTMITSLLKTTSLQIDHITQLMRTVGFRIRH